MATEPTWTWRLRADAAERWHSRRWYSLLRLCSESATGFNRLANAVGLVLTIGFVVGYLRRASSPIPVVIYTLAVTAILLAVKGLVAHATRLVLRDQRIVGGADTTYRFDKLVPQRAQRIALVGQNLAARFDERFEITVQGIQTLLSRQGSGGIRRVDEIWLVLQTPLALLSVHPDAARHLCSVTLPGLERLANAINDKRVKVAFHPATTLSMIVVDWDRDSRLAIVGPKMQTIPIIDRRLSLVLSGSALDSVAPHFDRFLSEASRREFPGACAAPLAQAATRLRELFELEIVRSVGEYVREEEDRMYRNPCISALANKPLQPTSGAGVVPI